MKSQKIPYITIVLSILTIVCSLYVNFRISGTAFGKIKYFELEPYGGITFQHLRELELWRLFVSQLIHFKQSHMIFNVLSLFLLGLLLEKNVGGIRFFILWFVSGACGTLAATLTVEPPWNLGTGASQAVMGVAAFAVVLLWQKRDSSLRLKIVVCIAVIPALIIDLIYAHHPKLGHIVGFIVGWAISVFYLRKLEIKEKQDNKHSRLTAYSPAITRKNNGIKMRTSILEQSKAQAQVLIPVFDELKAELGEEKALEIMHKALEKWGKDAGRQIKDMIPGNPVEKIAAATPYYSMDDAIDYEIIQQTSEVFEYKVTSCKYADFYKELGQPELGFRFVCVHDFSITAGISSDLELTRKNTIMQGDSQCHFLYKLKK